MIQSITHVILFASLAISFAQADADEAKTIPLLEVYVLDSIEALPEGSRPFLQVEEILDLSIMPRREPDITYIAITLSEAGAGKLLKATAENKGKVLVTVIGGEIISKPHILSELRSGNLPIRVENEDFKRVYGRLELLMKPRGDAAPLQKAAEDSEHPALGNGSSPQH